MKITYDILRVFRAVLATACLVLASGATYYVEKAGTDTGNGSITNPWQTVGHALSVGGPGDTINIGFGEFREFLLITNPITLNGQNTYNAVKPPLKRHNSVTAIRAPFASPSGPVITVQTNNVTIQNLTIYGDPDTNSVGSVLYGIYTEHRPITVNNCKIANIFGRGIECRGTAPPPSPADNDSARSYLGYNLISNISHSIFADGIFLESTQATCEFNEISNITGLYAHAGIYISHCDYTANMSAPITIRNNFFHECAQAIWANDPITPNENILISGNTITDSLIGIRLTSSGGRAFINQNQIHVRGISASGLTPARGIWIQADDDPWGAYPTDHIISHNSLSSEAVTNDGSIGMFFSYATQPPGTDNNGVRATVETNYVYFFAIGSLIESGNTGVAITNDPLVEVVYHYNDIYGSVTSAIMTTGFSYTVDAASNFMGYVVWPPAVSTNVDYSGSTNGGSFTLDIDGDSWLDHVDPDDDGDGWNDTDEYAVGTYPFRADSDFDGMNDPQEYFVAGTDPLDPASALRLNQFVWTSTNGAAFEWPSVTGRTYYVYRTTNLFSGFGAPITNFPATIPTNYYTDSSATGTTYFYRISVTN